MRVHARVWLVGLVLGVLVAGFAPAGALGFGIEKFAAVNCKQTAPECASTGAPFYFPVEPEFTKAKNEGFTQAGGRVPYGVTTFKVLTEGSVGKEYPAGLWPEGVGKTLDPTKILSFIRTDVAPGLATNPFAPERCSMEKFDGALGEVAEGAFLEPECEEGSEIGVNRVVVYIPAANADVPLEGEVYNLNPGEGWASKFGVAIYLGTLGPEYTGLYAHTIINGNVEWGRQAEPRGTGKGDFHDYFEIEVSPKLPLVSSRLVFEGNINEEHEVGEGDFITNPTRCENTANLETRLSLKDLGGEEKQKTYKPPPGIEIEGCPLEFPINFSLASGGSGSEEPNQFTASASESHNPAATDGSQVKSASFTLPEGMTLNPSAAKNLEACTEAQAHQEGTVFGEAFGVSCPAGSKIGTVALEVPTLPPGSLVGSVYLGAPNTGVITGPPYKIYVVANNPGYNVSVRLLGEAIPDEHTGQVTTYFRNPPEQPFTSLALHFERGVLAPVANPLICGTPEGSANFEPTAAPGTSVSRAFGVSVTGCSSVPPPFNPTQSTATTNANAGQSTNFTLNLARSDGEQYIGAVKTVLPPGLVGKIAIVERCGEPAASSETIACPAGSQIGTATVHAGAGPEPYTFTGPVYLTGSYGAYPYGMSVKVPALAPPFNFGTVVTRAGITVNPITGQVIVESSLPTIRQGIPLRIKGISIAITKSGFMLNPTNCGKLETVSTLSGFATLAAGGPTASKSLPTPFQVANCGALKFSPKFKASSSAKNSRSNGAMLTTEVTQPGGQANIKSVKVQLPRSLPSRLTTLQKACTEQVFAVNPLRCPTGAFVGGAVVHTSTLPQPLRGPAILVSHAGAAFPDLDLVVEDPNHLRVILVGNTNIKNGITTTTFASTPDTPVTSVRVELPMGSHSALGAYGNLCAKPLVMPTTMTSQNGKSFKQNTIISVGGCKVEVIGRKTVGNTAYLTVRAPAAGRVSASGIGLVTVHKKSKKPHQVISLKVPLSSEGRRRFKPLPVYIRVGFKPKHGGSSVAVAKVTFR